MNKVWIALLVAAMAATGCSESSDDGGGTGGDGGMGGDMGTGGMGGDTGTGGDGGMGGDMGTGGMGGDTGTGGTAGVGGGSTPAFYEENFESLDSTSATALADEDWEFFAAVFDGTQDPPVFKFPYSGPAPNATADATGNTFISAVVTGEGGDLQGAQQLSVFSDYNCCDPNQGHRNGTDLVEINVFINIIPEISADDVGKTLTFTFDAKVGNLEGNTTAFAFIKTLDPDNNFDTTNNITQQTDNIGNTWARFQIELEIDAGLEGQLLQIGFVNTASDFEGSGVFYDNLRADLE